METDLFVPRQHASFLHPPNVVIVALLSDVFHVGDSGESVISVVNRHASIRNKSFLSNVE